MMDVLSLQDMMALSKVWMFREGRGAETADVLFYKGDSKFAGGQEISVIGQWVS
jgi:hypothetical protein